MYKKNKKASLILVLVLIFVAMFAFSSCGSDDSKGNDVDKKVWKFAHSGSTGDVIDAYAVKFKEAVESEFDNVTVELYPANQLGWDDERFELVKSGGAEFAMVATPFIGKIIPEAEVFGINCMMPTDTEVLSKVLREGQAAGMINDALQEQNLTSMDWYHEDFSCWTSNKEIRKLSDFKGQKIRCLDSAIEIANIESLGASATSMPFSEVYSSLQVGTIDGQQNPITFIESGKLYEVQKYLVKSNHAVVIDLIISNNDFLDSLTDDERAKLEKVFIDVNEYAESKQKDMIEASLQTIIDSGDTEIIELEDKVMEEIKAKSSYPQEVFIKKNGEKAEKILNLLKEDIKSFE